MSDLFGRIKSGAEKVVKGADKLVDVKKIEYEIGQIKGQMEDLQKKLGEITYRHYINKEPESGESVEVCQNISRLQQQINEKEEEIKRINEGVPSPQGVVSPAPVYSAASAPVEQPSTASQVTSGAPSPHGRFCSNCGKEVAAENKFCPYCGNKMA